MEMLFKNFWIMFILVTFFNVYQFKKKTAKFIIDNPDKAYGYNLIFKNFLIFGCIPWLIIGLGNTFGFTSSVFDYFQPADLNPLVLIFHFSILCIWILMVRFIFFKNGAKFLENHPGLIVINNFGTINENPSEKSIKILTIVGLIGGILALILMWCIDIPIENIK